jgi:hypothetical protein
MGNMKNLIVANYNVNDVAPESAGEFSELSWQGVVLRDGLAKTFRLRKGEMISAVIITDNGLKVKIVNIVNKAELTT